MLSLKLRFALRALLKNKTYTVINVVGLALGLAVSMGVYLFLKSELTYDQHFNNHETVFRVQSEFELNNRTDKLAGAGYAMAPLLAEEFEYVKDAGRLLHINQKIRFTALQKEEFVGDVALADSNFLNTIGLSLIAGDASSALAKPQHIVLSTSLARQFFGDENPLGKHISTANFTYTVSGLFEDLPANTHHKFSALISGFYNSLEEQAFLASLWDPGIFTFVRLRQPYQHSKLLVDFDGFYNKYMRQLGENLGGTYQIVLTPLAEVHFQKGYQFDKTIGNKAYLYAYAGVGLLILVLACINYINMATARSLKRIKEIGMRKLLGASTNDVRALVLAESLLLSLAALFLGFVLLELSLSFTNLNTIIQKNIQLSFTEHPALLWFPLLLSLVVGLLSGLYPANILSSVSGLLAVKGAKANRKASLVVRKVLVGFQFTISVAVVITALHMYRQIEFIKHKDLGFNKDNVLLIPLQDSLTMYKIPALQKELTKSKYVQSAATATSVIGKGTGRALVSVENEEGKQEKRILDFMQVSSNYFETMQIDLVKGRYFNDEDFVLERNYAVVNESMVRSMDLENPIGKHVFWEYNEDGEPLEKAIVVGVVADFNAHSLHDPIEPLVIGMEKKSKGILHLRVSGDSFSQAIASIESIWTADKSNRPFNFSFLDEDLSQQYSEEQKQSKLLLFLTYLAIFISFLGLTGLASFTTALRTKEIGIRKVLGAEVYQMIQLIFRDMLKLVMISVLLAIPLAYFLTSYWLQNFAFTTSLSGLVFAFSAIMSIMVSYLIVSYHSYKVATQKVVHTLKNE